MRSFTKEGTTIVYTLGTVARNDAQHYASVHDAARAFRDANAEDRPYLIRTERLPDNRESASMPGQTTCVEKEGVCKYGKFIGGNDEALKRAYADAPRPEQSEVCQLDMKTTRENADEMGSDIGRDIGQ